MTLSLLDETTDKELHKIIRSVHTFVTTHAIYNIQWNMDLVIEVHRFLETGAVNESFHNAEYFLFVGLYYYTIKHVRESEHYLRKGKRLGSKKAENVLDDIFWYKNETIVKKVEKQHAERIYTEYIRWLETR
jgi:hypothetical protein